MSNRRRTKIRMSATYADLYRRSRSPLLARPARTRTLVDRPLEYGANKIFATGRGGATRRYWSKAGLAADHRRGLELFEAPRAPSAYEARADAAGNQPARPN